MDDKVPTGYVLCIECGDKYPAADICKFDNKCFYCCKHEPFPDGPRPAILVQ